ncbi:MAG: N-6 DNA methylase [Leptospiraceae bacterium]|nr:N-6 DNA methylase [Leptospiraceae bacterium]MCP5493730.1 N-6 DNA methylase [Leptospiraceae bacterium]
MVKLKDSALRRYVRSILFSIDFIENHLVDLDDFKNLDEIYLNEKFKEICSYYKGNLKSISEAQLESNFLQPIFKSLEHIYEVQTTKRSEDIEEGTKRIDYAFFYSEEDKDIFHKNYSQRNSIKYSSCSTICETKSWGLLGGYDRIRKNDNSDPIWQLKKSYLDPINPKEQKATVPFGILTDGKFWRIYSYRTETDKFFELNLEEVIQRKDFYGFKIFWFFFSKEAFKGKSYLSSVEAGSKKLQSQVSEELRKQVYISLELIATGLFRVYKSGKREWDEFKKYPEMQAFIETKSIDEIDVEDEKTEQVVLNIIYKESLVYLFRVLFLLYADHRNLFKHRKVETVFYNLLNKIELYTDKIGGISDRAENIADKNDDYDIDGVFEEIDKEFNGGIFSQKLHPVLNRFDIDNILYANAIDYLTRTLDEKTKKTLRVDFSVLEVRHLGTIYEGLLEYKLSKTSEEKSIPLLSDHKRSRKLLKDDLYLVNDKGERKSSGSYYTPDYIVEYMVKNTVGPLINEIELEEIDIKQKIFKIFSLKVCDPAMGSGHFLVEVIGYISDRIESMIHKEMEPFQNKPGRKSKKLIELESLLQNSEDGLYKSIISKRCIYGVDKNPMAVELAKLSIWIFTLQKNRKLEFFDYNLRCGDSLIGSKGKTFSSRLETESRERTLFASNEELYQDVVENFKEEFKKYFEFESVEERMKYYESTIRPNQQKLKYLANIELAIDFADKDDEIHLLYKSHKTELLNLIRMNGEYIKKLIKGSVVTDWEIQLFKRAKKVRDEYNPIHWELDFPNVFIEKGRFDVVVGNPPYVDNRGFNKKILKFLYRTFPNSFQKSGTDQFKTTKLNLIAPFIEKTHHLLTYQGFTSYIFHKNIFKTNGYSSIRKFILDNYDIKILADWGRGQFKEVTAETATFIIRNCNVVNDKIVVEFYNLSHKINESHNLQSLFSSSYEYIFGIYSDFSDRKILELIEKNTMPLQEFVNINNGIVTGNDELYLSDNKINESYKKIVRGKNIKRYGCLLEKEYVLYDRDKLLRARDESIFNADEKLIMQMININFVITYDNEQFYNLGTTYSITKKANVSLKYLLSILCSSTIEYYYKKKFTNSSSLTNAISTQNLFEIPIKIIPQKPFIQKADTMLTKNKELGEVTAKFTKLLKSDLKLEKLSDKLENWYLLTWDEFLSELKKKKVELSLNSKPQWMDYFESEKKKALAIKKVIDKTDKEIDKMVYELYGLTEEEIKIIER